MNAGITFEQLKSQWTPNSASEIASLQAMYYGVSEPLRPLLADAEAARDAAKTEFDNYSSTLGVREKYLRGWFGGNKDAVAKRADLKQTMTAAGEKAESLFGFACDLDADARKRVRELTRASDPQFAAQCDESDHFRKAKEIASKLSSQVKKVLDQLSEAEDLQMRKDGGEETAGFAAGQARKKAAAAMAELNQSLPDFAKRLTDARIDVGSLKGSNVSVGGGVGEFLMGDTWSQAVSGLSATGKLDKAGAQMKSLKKQVDEINRAISDRIRSIDGQIDARVEQLWGIKQFDGSPTATASNADDADEANAVDDANDANDGL